MSEKAQEIIEILLKNIYNGGDQKILYNENISTSINKIRSIKKLPLIFSLQHNLLRHSNYYPVKNCEIQHCFECLKERISQGFDTCEHNEKLSPYEMHHIIWISNDN